jgi:predicted Zn-ribbon and HTH transcriptional regulator
MKWYKKDIETLIELIRQGNTYDEIGVIMKRSRSSIKAKLLKLGETYRKYSENNYYEKVNCKNCGIEFKSLMSNKQKFCNHTCAASYNNVIRGKRSQETKNKISKSLKSKKKEKYDLNPKKCMKCGEHIPYSKWCNYRKNCDECNIIIRKNMGRILGQKTSQTKIKRSKDEINLYELCKMSFNDVEHNKIISSGWDADIVINDYKILILWNGPWHYKQLPLKNHSLNQVQTRDKIKQKLFESLGWRVIIFEDRYYTPYTAFDYLKNIIRDISPHSHKV